MAEVITEVCIVKHYGFVIFEKLTDFVVS